MRPDAFAAVMATGIVSIAAAEHGWPVVAVVLAVVASIVMLTLTWFGVGALRSWRFDDVDTPVGLLTFVAACCVLATRVDRYVLLGGLALLGWVVLMPFVARAAWPLRGRGLRDGAHGGWQLVSVSASGLVMVWVLAGQVWCGFAFWVFALVAYALVAGVVGWRAFHDPAVRRDVPPDHWILMGAVAIATLAGERLHAALPAGPVSDVVRVVTIATWVVASVQLVPLAILGWRRARDWPAVFPVGMYSVSTRAMSVELGWRVLDGVSLVFLVVALTLWLLTLLRFVHSHPRSPRFSVHESRAGSRRRHGRGTR